MKATSKTKAELVAEIDSLRSKLAELESAEARRDPLSCETLDNSSSDESSKKQLEHAEKSLGRRFCESLPTNECIIEVLNRATYGLFILDERLVVKYFNKAAEKLLGRPGDEVVNRNLLDVFPEARGSIFEKQYLRALKEKQAFFFEAYFEEQPYRNWYDVSVSPCKDGLVVHFVVTTERKQAEEALKERLRFEQFLSSLSARFSSLPGDRAAAEIENGLMEIGKLMELDAAAVIQRIKAGEKFASTHSWAAPGLPAFTGFIISDNLLWLTDQVRRGALVALERLPDDFPPEAHAEKAFCRKWACKSLVSIPLQVGGSILGAVMFASTREFREWPQSAVQRLKLLGEIFANALSRAQIEERARQLRAELSHVSRAATLGELAASLAHELNQPLAAVLANAQAAQRFLAKDTKDLQVITEILDDIIADDKRAGAIIYKLRALLKKGEPKFEPLNVNAITAEVVALLKNDAMIRGVTLDLRAFDGLPEAVGDKIQLQQVLMNLILNACDVAASEAPDHRTVIIKTEPDDNQAVRVTIRDFGPGLPADPMRLFAPFYSTKANGLGMGLTISQSIVEAHGGRIWAYNNPDRGASFSFTIATTAGDAHGK